MKSVTMLVIAALALGNILFPVIAQEQPKPSTRDERATAMRVARILEADPLNKDSKRLRQWLTSLLDRVPDIQVDTCAGLLEPVVLSRDTNEIYSAILKPQMRFAGAAFVIRHPELADDRVAVNVSGLEGTLRAYESILREKPVMKIPFFDDLLLKRQKGELRSFVEQTLAAKCRPKE